MPNTMWTMANAARQQCKRLFFLITATCKRLTANQQKTTPNTIPFPDFIEEVIRVIRPSPKFGRLIIALPKFEETGKALWDAHERSNTIQALSLGQVMDLCLAHISSNAFVKDCLNLRRPKFAVVDKLSGPCSILHGTRQLKKDIKRGRWSEEALKMLLLAMAHDDLDLTRKIALAIEKATKGGNVNYFFGIEEEVRNEMFRHAYEFTLDNHHNIVTSHPVGPAILQTVQKDILDVVTEESSAETKFYALWAMASITYTVTMQSPLNMGIYLLEERVRNELLNGMWELWKLCTDDDVDFLMLKEKSVRHNHLDGFEAKMASIQTLSDREATDLFLEDIILAGELAMIFSTRRSRFEFGSMVAVQSRLADQLIQWRMIGFHSFGDDGEEAFIQTLRCSLDIILRSRIHSRTKSYTLRQALASVIQLGRLIDRVRLDFPELKGVQTPDVDNMVTDALHFIICEMSTTKAKRHEFRRDKTIVCSIEMLVQTAYVHKRNFPGLRGVLRKTRLIMDMTEEFFEEVDGADGDGGSGGSGGDERDERDTL